MRLVGKIGWSLTAKVTAAALQMVILILMARGLSSHDFAFFASVNVVLFAVCALNGFGLQRQMQLRRARDQRDPELPRLFSVWLTLILASASIWLVATSVLGLLDHRYWLLLPMAVWLWFNQVTTVWNAMSLTDGRPQDLMPSYLWRRLTIVVGVVVASAVGMDLLLAWSLSSAAGAVLAYVFGRGRQERWARMIQPGWGLSDLRGSLDLAYWWTSVGVEIRDLDVVAIGLISSGTGALYALPARLIKPMNLVTVATNSVVFPMLARRPVVSRRQLLAGCIAGTAPVALIAGFLVAIAPYLPHLVGEQYTAAIPVLRVLCIAAVITGFGSLVLAFLQTRSGSANAFAGRAVLGFGLLQVPVAAGGSVWAGATGAAWAAVTCQAVLVSLLTQRSLRECDRAAKRELARDGG